MRRSVLIALALAGVAGSGALRANDGVAEMAAGGLVLRQTRDIDMVSEDLYVSADEIRVAYVFRNRSRRPVRTIVAFPLPDRNLAEMGDGETAWPSEFRTMVDGRPIQMQVERRAFVRGIEHTALLRALRIPIAGENIHTAASEAIERLPAAQQQRLERLGLVEGFTIEGGRRAYEPRWTVREMWYREQVFPVGRGVRVQHRYRPGAGGTAGSGLPDPEYRRGENGRYQIDRYCIDDPFLAAVDRIRGGRPESPFFSETHLTYILTTGANWRSPIGDFRLVVDKGRADNLVSFCGEGVRRIGPTQFEIRRRNWRPTRDLHVLILRGER